MEKQKIIEIIKAKYQDTFDVDDKTGNLTFKSKNGIPAFEMILVEGGTYENDEGAKVTISPFFMGKYAVTQELYQAVMHKNPSYFQGTNHPVEQVSWFDSVDFCNTLNKKPICNADYHFLTSNKEKTTDISAIEGFRLPTEAEWEFAARGGKDFAHNRLEYAGSDNLDAVGWYDENNEYETKPVGLKFPNKLGIYDMSGNVWEWCWDWYDNNFYAKRDTYNPVNLGKGSDRVLRGGSWRFDADFSQVANRFIIEPDFRLIHIGFRMVWGFSVHEEPRKPIKYKTWKFWT